MSMFESLLSGMRDGVLILDQAGQIIYANQAAAEIFAVPPEEVLNKRLLEAVRLTELSELFEVAAQKREPQTKEIKSFYPSEKTLLVSINPIKESNIAIILRDITDMKKLENLRSEFVANVSHELKTPLTAIHGLAETLLNGALEDKKHNVEFIEKIERQAEILSILIDDLLEISKLESRRGPGDFQPIKIVRLIRRAADLVADKARIKKINLALTCLDEELLISGIEEHVFRALLNLLDNAVKYTEPGGNITIDCTKEPGQISLSVSDTGIGISKEHLPRLFERFYRVDKARSRDLGGTGLGLSIVKHVMNLHNGSVDVESEEGKGSKFTLVFPA